MTWPTPDAASPDAAALKVLDAMLTTGKSSRLYEALVYRQQIADPGFLQPGPAPAAGHVPGRRHHGRRARPPNEARPRCRAQLDKLRDAPVSAAELAAAKNQLICPASAPA